jgi:hypothetical protein
MIKYQNYSHYKLPITTNPLEYGKLIEQIGNKYIIQLNTTDVVIIYKINNFNLVKFFKNGELMFEYRDFLKSENIFIRTISDQRYTFEKGKLISTEILSSLGSTFIYPLYKDTKSITITPSLNFKNIIKYSENRNKKAKLLILLFMFLIYIIKIILFFYI